MYNPTASRPRNEVGLSRLTMLAVKDISIWFGNKISINLTVPTDEKIIVSKARVTEFKNWYSF